MGQKEVPPLPSIWNVPYRPNPFFTGREDILSRLHTTLTTGKPAALTQPQAISGLGGIGKTQTAVEYTHRYSSEYHAVLWAKADSREVLVSDFVSIADVLNLPEKNEQDQNCIVDAVKRWLQVNKGWLLILDNVDDLSMVNNFIPSTDGHILLTTRIQATGSIASSIEIDKMEAEKDGALFLLRRAKLIDKATQEDQLKAKEISEVMDGLPLALDQAGAFIEETPSSLSEYLELYHKERIFLLQERGESSTDHPESVTVTFLLSFDKVEKANPAAADLLRLCAFLYPDNIPEEIITEGASEVGPILQPVASNPIQFKKAIAELRKYSLVRRNAESKTLSIHRLVQAVIKDGMDENEQRLWAERTVKAVYQAFSRVEPRRSLQSQKFLPHSQICALLIQQEEMTFPTAWELLNLAGYYLQEHGQYIEAEKYHKQSLALREKTLGHEHPDVAISLSNLGSTYYAQGNYSKAKQFHQQALAIREKALESKHTDVTYTDVALTLNNLALPYITLGEYPKARSLLRRALALNKKNLGSKHPNTALNLNNLASLYGDESKYTQAEQFYKQALDIWKRSFGSNHPYVAITLNNLAQLYVKQGKYNQAEPLYKQSLVIREQTLGTEHPAVATCLNNLGQVYYAQGKYDQAKQVFEKALDIRERTFGPEHDEVATTLNNLAILYHAVDQDALADKLFQQSLKIREQRLGAEHLYVVQSLQNYAGLLRDMNRYSEAAILEARARAIQAKKAQTVQTSKSQNLEFIYQHDLKLGE